MLYIILSTYVCVYTTSPVKSTRRRDPPGRENNDSIYTYVTNVRRDRFSALDAKTTTTAMVGKILLLLLFYRQTNIRCFVLIQLPSELVYLYASRLSSVCSSTRQIKTSPRSLKTLFFILSLKFKQPQRDRNAFTKRKNNYELYLKSKITNNYIDISKSGCSKSTREKDHTTDYLV